MFCDILLYNYRIYEPEGKAWLQIMKTKLDNLENKFWKDLTEIVVFGFGRQGKKMYTTLNRDFNIVAIVDNSPEKQGETLDKERIGSSG